MCLTLDRLELFGASCEAEVHNESISQERRLKIVHSKNIRLALPKSEHWMRVEFKDLVDSINLIFKADRSFNSTRGCMKTHGERSIEKSASIFVEVPYACNMYVPFWHALCLASLCVMHV